jgi:hypothetical protein
MSLIYEQHLLLLLKFYNEYGTLSLGTVNYMSENLTTSINSLGE